MRLPKAYNPKDYETGIYALWEKGRAFEPKNRGSKGTYSIVVPPPNANGNLHLGHGLTLAIEDILTRYHRMKGKAALLLPGADHAGFETQVVYEKQLQKQGKSRFDYTREELYKQIWQFVAKNKENYQLQFRKLGASVDWSRYTYTLDDKIVKLAFKTFKKMWDEGLIYRGERLVNYCTFHRTGFADIEVVYEDAETPLYYMKYGPFTLATTRPETKFGDTAVAVNPSDKRYKEWIGKVVTVEGVNGPFDIQVVGDNMVDPDFGTGVVKITPAHDFNDWEVAQRHNLPAVRVINHDGTLNEKTGRFRGMTVLEARKAVVEALKEKGLLVKVDGHYKNRVGHCYKCGTVIEPMLLEQWFIDMKPLSAPAIKALNDKKIKFYPETKRSQLIKYLEGLKDWNISRQIAWGIPIPAFQNVDDSDDWIYDERVDQEILEIDGKTYRRDPDVFDTWFSSSSWPYSTLGYPDHADFKQFYPLSVMETAADILYPWVSRMIMFGLYMTKDIPFEDVYLHGLIQDEHGQKMSKSKGNVIDPMEAIEEYGSDAFRMGIIANEAPSAARPYDTSKLVGARNFTNKLWNITRFIDDKVGDNKPADKPYPKTAQDHWILSKLQQVTEVVSRDLDNYRFADAYENLYQFIWNDFADWYIEASKANTNPDLLACVLTASLKLAHPFAPFVTETIWQALGWEGKSLLITSSWPTPVETDSKEAKTFEKIKTIVSEIRYLSTSLKLSKPTVYFSDDKLLSENTELVMQLANLNEMIEELTMGKGIKLTSTAGHAWLEVKPETIKKYKDELKERIHAQDSTIKQLKRRLANKSYVANAPEAVVNQTKSQLADAEDRLTKLTEEQKRWKT